MRPVRFSHNVRVSAEIRRAFGFALLVAAVVQLPLVVLAVRGADAAEPGSLLETLVSASQLPALLITAPKPEPPPRDPAFIDPSAVVEGARSVMPSGVTLVAAANTVVMALIAYMALRTLYVIWPRRTPSRAARTGR